MERVRAVLARHLPRYRINSITRLRGGLDNVAYAVNDELIVRFRRAPDPVALEREAELLRKVARISPVPVPEPMFTDAEAGCIGYFKLSGVPLIAVQMSNEDDIVSQLRPLLSALHATPVERVAGLAGVDDYPMHEWLREAAEGFETVAESVPERFHARIGEFLGTRPPRQGTHQSLCHNDLGIEHILVRAPIWTVCGVIDWSDAAIADPARDYGLLYRDLGPAALPGGDLRDRAVFYARCSVFEDLAYGFRTGQGTYVTKCLASLEWLFP